MIIVPSNPPDTYREALSAVLDYRAWHPFELRLGPAPRWSPAAAHPEEALADVRRGEVRLDPYAAIRRGQRALILLEADVPPDGSP